MRLVAFQVLGDEQVENLLIPVTSVIAVFVNEDSCGLIISGNQKFEVKESLDEVCKLLGWNTLSTSGYKKSNRESLSQVFRKLKDTQPK